MNPDFRGIMTLDNLEPPNDTPFNKNIPVANQAFSEVLEVIYPTTRQI
jgi:hypothetical protein